MQEGPSDTKTQEKIKEKVHITPSNYHLIVNVPPS
jgi:hypothetical protein